MVLPLYQLEIFMKKDVHCTRCGTVVDLKNFKNKRFIDCPHCHLQMTYDKKTNFRVTFVQIIIYILSCAAVLPFSLKLSLEEYSMQYYLFLGGCIVFFICVSLIANDLSAKIINLLFGLTYTKYEDPDKNKKKKGKK